MSSDFPKFFAVAAIIVVLLAVGVLGIIIGYNLKPATSISASSEKADITLVVQSDLTLGPDGQLHDSFVPCNFTVYANQVVDLTVVNYDSGEHSFTSPSLGVNFAIPPSNVNGVTQQFPISSSLKPTQEFIAGTATNPCDTDAGGWAMTTGSDGQPGQIGFMGGFVTVLPG